MKSSTDTSCAGWRSGPWKMPAAVTTPEIRPSVVVRGRDRRGRPRRRRRRRTAYAAAGPPAAVIIAAVSSALSAWRSSTATAAPSRAARTAVARPMPLPPPVTSTVRPLKVAHAGERTGVLAVTRMSATSRERRCTPSTARSSSSPGRARASARAWRCTSARAARRIVVAEWKDELMARDVRRARRRSASPTTASSATSSRTRPDRRDGRGDGRALRPRRRLDQQRADVPAALADRRGERTRRRRVLRLGREGHAVGDAGGVPAHARAGVGSHRQLRVVDGHHRRRGLRGVQRVEGGDPRAARAPPRASGRSTASS